MFITTEPSKECGMKEKLLVAATGASGFPLTISLLQAIAEKPVETHLVVSEHAWEVLKHESNKEKKEVLELADKTHDPKDISSSICSGSFKINGMVIVPCSINTLGHIANGLEHNAITRAAGVNLKQERKVVLVPRDTPMTLPALKNMVKAKEAGCSILPPMLEYYTQPKKVEECTDYITGRILELLDIQHDLYKRWKK